VFATAVVGLVVRLGHLLIAVVVTALVLLILELRFIPGLRYLDARSYLGHLPADRDTAGTGTDRPVRSGPKAPATGRVLALAWIHRPLMAEALGPAAESLPD